MPAIWVADPGGAGAFSDWIIVFLIAITARLVAAARRHVASSSDQGAVVGTILSDADQAVMFEPAPL